MSANTDLEKNESSWTSRQQIGFYYLQQNPLKEEQAVLDEEKGTEFFTFTYKGSVKDPPEVILPDDKFNFPGILYDLDQLTLYSARSSQTLEITQFVPEGWQLKAVRMINAAYKAPEQFEAVNNTFYLNIENQEIIIGDFNHFSPLVAEQFIREVIEKILYARFIAEVGIAYNEDAYKRMMDIVKIRKDEVFISFNTLKNLDEPSNEIEELLKRPFLS